MTFSYIPTDSLQHACLSEIRETSCIISCVALRGAKLPAACARFQSIVWPSLALPGTDPATHCAGTNHSKVRVLYEYSTSTVGVFPGYFWYSTVITEK